MNNRILLIILFMIAICLITTLIILLIPNKKNKDNNEIIKDENFKHSYLYVDKEEKNVFFNSFISQCGKRLADLLFLGIIFVIIILFISSMGLAINDILK